MIGHIDGYYVAAQIRLLRQVHHGAILMLEGETDAKVFDRFIDKDRCTTEVTFGKPNLVKALDLLEDNGFAGVLGFADLDFDQILDAKYQLENLYRTECHDLDLTIFLSVALATYLSEHADKQLLNANCNGNLDQVRKIVFDACMTLAYCRLVSERHKLKLDFKDLQIDRFVNAANLSVDSDALLTEILASSHSTCTLAKLKALIHLESANNYDQTMMVNGHDAAEILGITLRQLIGKRKVVHTWCSEIESGLRLAFDWAAFCKTPCFSDLKDWESGNEAYRILPAL